MYNTSPVLGTLFRHAEISSITRGVHGQWIATVLLDEAQYETSTFWGYTKNEVVQAVKDRYRM